MESKQLYAESSSKRFAFGMDGSGCGKQNPRVSEKLVPSRLRKTGMMFHYFDALRPLDYWKESQTSRSQQERAGQHESTMINEYMSAHSSAGSLRNGTHLSFHWFIFAALLGLICFHVYAFTSTSQIRITLFYSVRTSCKLLCLRVSLPRWLKLGVYSARLPEARRTFPFRSHLHKRCSRLFLLASVVFICKKWYERNVLNLQQMHIILFIKIWKANNFTQRAAQSGLLSGWMALDVVSRTREYQRNWFQVDFEKLE
ncbi:Hypothetical_protein [Hexamita inflata]|uniref:Hypothetical_protein n=1 Tax=Hexamita inflata TaxID=28002 RepID=A0AA86UB02_9EUKA|nr:Hypothetical protein HINF_LOCUS38250 [Hexamita inflata]